MHHFLGFFRPRYRIIRDKNDSCTVQVWHWSFPFWIDLWPGEPASPTLPDAIQRLQEHKAAERNRIAWRDPDNWKAIRKNPPRR